MAVRRAAGGALAHAAEPDGDEVGLAHLIRQTLRERKRADGGCGTRGRT